MHTKDIRLIFYLPSLQSYRDRAHLIRRIARRVGKAVLVTSRFDMEPEQIGLDAHLEVIQVLEGVRGLGRTGFAASRVVEGLLRNDHFNIVHDTFGHLLPLFFRRRRFPGCVFVTSQYNLAEWDFNHFLRHRYPLSHFIKYRDLRRWLQRIMIQRLIFRLSDAIIVQAPGLVKRVLEYIHVPRMQVRWLPNNVDFYGLKYCQSNQKSVRSINKHAVELLYISGYAVGRGFEVMLDTLGYLSSKGVDIHATAVGEFAAIDRSYLTSKIRNSGVGDHCLTLLPRVDRNTLGEYYRSSDWLFHQTLVDGSPRVVLEALACGLPAIASYHPGISVLDPHRSFIAFAEFGDVEAIAQIIAGEMHDPGTHEARARRGQAYVRQHFSSEAVSQLYVKLYLDLLDGK